MSQSNKCSFCDQELSEQAWNVYQINCEEWEAHKEAAIADPMNADHRLPVPLPTCDECLADIAENQRDCVDHAERIGGLQRRTARRAMMILGVAILLIFFFAWLMDR